MYKIPKLLSSLQKSMQADKLIDSSMPYDTVIEHCSMKILQIFERRLKLKLKYD